MFSDDRAVGVHLDHRGARRERRHRRRLVQGRQALADLPAGARLVLGLLGGQPAVVDGVGRLLQAGEGVAGVLGDHLPAERGRARRQQVQLSERQRVHPDRLGDELHVPLEPPEELDVAEAAVGGAVGLVGVDRVGVHPGVRDVVRTRCRVAGRPGDVDGVVGVGAGVPVHRHLLGRDLSVGAHPGLDAVGQGAATGQQAELLLPGRLQAHRPSPGLAREAGDAAARGGCPPFRRNRRRHGERRPGPGSGAAAWRCRRGCGP